MNDLSVVFTVQKRGAQFYVVRNSGAIGTTESGPYANVTAANSACVNAATALLARTSTNGIKAHYELYPV